MRTTHTQEHVTEYGVHWNFYFTLAGVYLVYSLLQLAGSAATSPVAAITMIAGTLCKSLQLVGLDTPTSLSYVLHTEV